MVLFMGVASPLFTRRMQPATENLLHQMDRPHASGPVLAVHPVATPVAASSAPAAPAAPYASVAAPATAAKRTAVASVPATVLETRP